MDVVFNLVPTIRPKTGVGNYAAELFAALQRQPGVTVDGFPSPATCDRLRRYFRPGGKPGVASLLGRVKGLAFAGAKRAGRWALAAAFRRAAAGYDLYHEPNFIPFPADGPTVITVHDLSVVRFPEWHPAERVKYHERCFAAGLAAGHHFITVSEAVRREMIAHLGTDPARVTAIPNGITPFADPGPARLAQVRQRYDLPPQYLLHVGTIEPRKNLLLLLQAYCDLPAVLRERCPLVLVGGWGWKSADVAAFLNGTARAAGVRQIGYVSDGDLPALYRMARALVYPTHYEGFGLPPVEMLAAGGAVLASNATAVREVIGSCGHFTAAGDRAGWRKAMAVAIADDDWLATLRVGGVATAKRYSWNRCAAETAAVYRRFERRAAAA